MKRYLTTLVFVILVLGAYGQDIVASGEGLYTINRAIIYKVIGNDISLNPQKPGKSYGLVNFSFTRSEPLSASIQQEFIDQLSKVQPNLRPALEKEFANSKIRNKFDQILTTYGYSSKNIADVLTAYLIMSWVVINDHEYFEEKGAKAVRKIVEANLAGSSTLVNITNTDKQRAAETLTYQGLIAVYTYYNLQSKGDREGIERLGLTLYNQSKTFGFDLKKYKLNDSGFTAR